MMTTHFSSCTEDCNCNKSSLDKSPAFHGNKKESYHKEGNRQFSKLNCVPVEKFYKEVSIKPRARIFRKKGNFVGRKVEITKNGQSIIFIPSFHDDLQRKEFANQDNVKKEQDLDEDKMNKTVMAHFSFCKDNCNCRNENIDANIADSEDNIVVHDEEQTVGSEKDSKDNEEDFVDDSNEISENDSFVEEPASAKEDQRKNIATEEENVNLTSNQEEPIYLSSILMEKSLENPSREEQPLDLTLIEQFTKIMPQESFEKENKNSNLATIDEQNVLNADLRPTQA